MPAKVTKKEFRGRVENAGFGHLKLTKFVGAHGANEFKCSKCGDDHVIKGRKAVSHGCPVCDKKLTKNTKIIEPEVYAREIRDLYGDRFVSLLRDQVVGVNLVKIPHRCGKCGGKFQKTYNYMIKGQAECWAKRCKSERASAIRTLAHDDVVARLAKMHNGKIKLIGSYRGMMRRHRFKCYVCLHTWKVPPNNVMNVGSGCPCCANEVKRRNGYKSYKLKVIERDGVTLRLQGFEPQALDWILAKFPKLTVRDIAFDNNGDAPVIRYKSGRRTRSYYPDMFIPSLNRLVEVKSNYTLGLSNGKNWRKNQEKAKACIAMGYKFTVLMMRADGSRMWLPKNWYLMTRKDVLTKMAFNAGMHAGNTIPQKTFLTRKGRINEAQAEVQDEVEEGRKRSGRTRRKRRTA